MKKIEAIVRKDKIEGIIKALKEVEVQEIMMTKVIGYGKQNGHIKLLEGENETIIFSQKINLEIFVMDNQVEQVINILIQEARTGSVGDGKITVYPLTDMYSYNGKTHFAVNYA
ncbi:P-II family nitrogen regulator [Dehalobacter sp. DCM]|uniref:P-II family nitrogen regulator n=1 Tax=Dehalobacter sp. DCM TaxID=2907827 RepID=UPI0030815F8F|nr:P-II family nitrogen regulator [Dehalobacter sp. DCM]